MTGRAALDERGYGLTDRFIAIETVVESAGVSRATIYRMVSAKTFPAPVKIGGASRWSEAEIDTWKAALKDARAA